MKHTQTATVREMRTLTNTCQKHAESARVAQDTAVAAAWRATRWSNETTDAAKRAEKAAHSARKASRAIIIALLLAILADVALHFFTH